MTPPPPVAGAAAPRTVGPRTRAASPSLASTAGRAVSAGAGALRTLPRPAMPAGLSLRGLLQGRALIAVFGVLLLGLVFLQVSLLKLNTAISLNVERAAKLERDNAQSRASISRLDAGRRVEDAAGQLGMVMPAAGAICFLNARRAGACSGGNAAEAGRGIDPVADVSAAADVLPDAATAAPTTATTTPTAQTTSPTGTQTPAQTTTGTAVTQQPATVAPAAGTQQQVTQPQTTPTTGAQVTPQTTTQGAAIQQTAGVQTGGLAATGTGG